MRWSVGLEHELQPTEGVRFAPMAQSIQLFTSQRLAFEPALGLYGVGCPEIEASGSLLIAGSFNSVDNDGIPRYGVVRLNGDGHYSFARRSRAITIIPATWRFRMA